MHKCLWMMLSEHRRKINRSRVSIFYSSFHTKSCTSIVVDVILSIVLPQSFVSMAMERSEFVLYSQLYMGMSAPQLISQWQIYSQLYCVHGCVIFKAKLKPKLHPIHRCAIFKGVLCHRFLSMTALNPELFTFHGCAVYGHVKSKAMLYLQHCCTNSSIIFITVIIIAVLYSKRCYIHGWSICLWPKLCYVNGCITFKAMYVYSCIISMAVWQTHRLLQWSCMHIVLWPYTNSNFRIPSDGYGIHRLHRMIQKLLYLMRKPGNTLCTIPKSIQTMQDITPHSIHNWNKILDIIICSKHYWTKQECCWIIHGA